CLLLLSVVAAAAEPAPVRVGGDPRYPPHHFLDETGEPAGFDVEVLRAIAADRDLELQFRFGEWNGVLDRLERGELDVVPKIFRAGLLLLSVVAAAAEPAPVRVGGDPRYPPHHFLDETGEPAGFDVEVLRAIAADRDLELQFRFGEWNGVLDRLERGELDVVP